MEQLTVKIAAKYLGAKVKVHYNQLLIDSKNINNAKLLEYIGTGTLLGIKQDSLLIEGEWDNIPGKFHDWIPVGLCKIILTPVSQITDEDAVKICDIVDAFISENRKVSVGKFIAVKLDYPYGHLNGINIIKIVNFMNENHYGYPIDFENDWIINLI